MIIGKHNFRCLHDHMGHWIIEPRYLQSLHSVFKSEGITFDTDILAGEHEDDEEMTPEERQRQEDMSITTMLPSGIMVVTIDGVIMRGQSSFGGTSSVQVRRVIRNAVSDPGVRGILLRIDSPGGTVAGTDELANDIRLANQVKPIRSHVEGMMASAAFWIGSQASAITASRTSQIGSLGTLAVVHDMSEMAKKDGIKVHVISTGEFKGAFEPGTEVTKAMLTDLQNIINDMNQFFKQGVQDGRGMEAKEVDKLFDGRVHLAETALKLNLIDNVGSFETAIRSFEAALIPEDDGSDEALAKAGAARIRSNI